MAFKIPLFKIYWDKEDIKAVSRAIKMGMNWAIGPEIEKFEKELAKYVGRKYTLVFNSGTSALHSLMMVYGLGPGDEIIVPSLTFIATANTPLFVGAEPVFAEVEEETFGLDPADVEKKITKKTKAIIPVHYGGCSCRIEELKEIAKKHNLILIEDAAESLGAKFFNKKVGRFGEVAEFSFCAPKIITTGEGGVVVTDSKKIYEKLKLIRSHGQVGSNYVALGYNFRMSNITAALGRAQLNKIDKLIRLRREKAQYLTQKLSKVEDIILPRPSKNYFHIYQMYTIRVKAGEKIRNALRDCLNKKGIGAKVYFKPVHLTSFYRKSFGFKKGLLPLTEKISNQVLTLPMYVALTKKEIDYMAKEIKNFFLKI